MGYRFRDFLKPTVTELYTMALEIPISISPWVAYLGVEFQGDQIGPILFTGAISVTPQVLTYLGARALEIWGNTKHRKYVGKVFRKSKVPKVKSLDDLD